MNLRIERRVASLESRRRRTALSDLTDEQLDVRIANCEARITSTIPGLLRTNNIASLRAEFAGIQCALVLLDAMETGGEPYATH